MKDQPLLVVVGQLTGSETDTGEVLLTEKFVAGVKKYLEYWPGRVRVVLRPSSEIGGNLDTRKYSLSELPFEVRFVDLSRIDQVKKSLSGATVVQGGSSHFLNGIAEHCKMAGIVYVHCSEYTLATRYQIVRAEERGLLRRLRRNVWEWGQERANLKEVRHATAVQCNGLPTYKQYSRINSNALLYFDNRITHDSTMKEFDLRPLPQMFDRDRPLRLAFSGRLVAMKGAGELIEIAGLLNQCNVPFELHIYGDGEKALEMRSRVAALDLGRVVTFHGNVDFNSELLPVMKSSIDLFVCCHVQGDPSCTYIETLACGVPIVGYLNEAFSGLLGLVDVGWGVAIFDQHGMVEKICQIAADPTLLERPRLAGLRFASNNTFDQVFKSRIDHMISSIEAGNDLGIESSDPKIGSGPYSIETGND